MSERLIDEGDLERDLSALLDGELPPEREAEVRELLAHSAEVRERLETLSRVDVALRSLPSPRVPADLGMRLQARVAAEGRAAPRRVRGRAPRRRRGVGWAVAAAAAAALAVWFAPRPVPEALPVVPAPGQQRVAQVLADASDEELAIAMEMELDALDDLELIENLELLEALDLLDDPIEEGRG